VSPVRAQRDSSSGRKGGSIVGETKDERVVRDGQDEWVGRVET
jgi:hypothetical protein